MADLLAGRNIALAEGRQLEDLAAMLEKEGATVVRCPLVSMLDAPDPAPVLEWLRELIGGRFDLVILMTGEAVRRLLGFAERSALRDSFIAALGKTRTLTRGPKPGRALRELGLTATMVAAAPTSAGVIETVQQENLAGKTVGLTLAGGPNGTLEEFLRQAGAQVRPVLPYVYAPAADTDRVLDLIHHLEAGQLDCLVFTSTPQVDRLFEVAHEHGLEKELRQGLQRTNIAAIGPVVAEALRDKQVTVHITPEQGFVMKNLVQQIKRGLMVQS
ncbi:MAG TPA: uroporphyrinogen-III synthase [Gemmataceae bacterium]|nr:uroporphyrinogen-III synthase [Gemmataceae bacterium]